MDLYNRGGQRQYRGQRQVLRGRGNAVERQPGAHRIQHCVLTGEHRRGSRGMARQAQSACGKSAAKGTETCQGFAGRFRVLRGGEMRIDPGGQKHRALFHGVPDYPPAVRRKAEARHTPVYLEMYRDHPPGGGCHRVQRFGIARGKYGLREGKLREQARLLRRRITENQNGCPRCVQAHGARLL